MIKYRPHRGSFRQAMREAVEFQSYSDMVEYVSEEWEVPTESITVSVGVVYDKRNGWIDTRYVLLDGMTVGMCATQFE